jgi:hypothetical protein
MFWTPAFAGVTGFRTFGEDSFLNFWHFRHMQL